MSWSIKDHYEGIKLFVIFNVEPGYNVSEGKKLSFDELGKYNLKTKDFENFNQGDTVLFFEAIKDNTQCDPILKMPTSLKIRDYGSQYQLILRTPNGKKIIKKTEEKVSNVKPNLS